MIPKGAKRHAARRVSDRIVAVSNPSIWRSVSIVRDWNGDDLMRGRPEFFDVDDRARRLSDLDGQLKARGG